MRPTYTLPTVQALRAQYESYLIRDMGECDAFASMLQNARDPEFHSEHDYVDANMTMHDALVRLVRDLNPNVSTVDIENWALPSVYDATCPILSLWNQACQEYRESCMARVTNWGAFCRWFGVIDPNGFPDSPDAREIRSSYAPTHWIPNSNGLLRSARYDDSGDNAWRVYVWDGDNPAGFEHRDEAFNLGGILIIPARIGNRVHAFLDSPSLGGFEYVGVIRTIEPCREIVVDLDLEPGLSYGR